MKKLALFLCSLLVVGATASAKEVMVEPTNSKEVMVEPTVVEEVVVLPVVAEPWGYVELRGGWDFWSEYDEFSDDGFKVLEKGADESGYEFAIEMYKSWPNFDLGLGLAYQDHAERDSRDLYADLSVGDGPTERYFEHFSGGEYKSIPVYLTGKYKINYWDWAVTPYLKAMVGYSFNFDEKDIDVSGTQSYKVSTDIDDGWYWAAGIGMEYNNFTMDVMYGINYADMDWKYDEANKGSFSNDYERVTLSVGYKFNIW